MAGKARAGAETSRTGKRFWREKLDANRVRDRLVNRVLRSAGWRVVRIWEHELAGGGTRGTERVMARIRKALADV